MISNILLWLGYKLDNAIKQKSIKYIVKKILQDITVLILANFIKIINLKMTWNNILMLRMHLLC